MIVDHLTTCTHTHNLQPIFRTPVCPLSVTHISNVHLPPLRFPHANTRPRPSPSLVLLPSTSCLCLRLNLRLRVNSRHRLPQQAVHAPERATGAAERADGGYGEPGRHDGRAGGLYQRVGRLVGWRVSDTLSLLSPFAFPRRGSFVPFCLVCLVCSLSHMSQEIRIGFGGKDGRRGGGGREADGRWHRQARETMDD